MVTVMLRSRHCHCFEREREIKAEENLSAVEDKVGEGIDSIYLFCPRGTNGVGITWTVSVANKLTNDYILIHFLPGPLFLYTLCQCL